MKDPIERQMAIDAIEDHIKEYTSDRPEYNMARRHMKELIEVLPSAQPDIIYCKDCKHWDGEKRGQFWYFEQCSLNQHTASCDDFCSFAERRTE